MQEQAAKIAAKANKKDEPSATKDGDEEQAKPAKKGEKAKPKSKARPYNRKELTEREIAKIKENLEKILPLEDCRPKGWQGVENFEPQKRLYSIVRLSKPHPGPRF